MSTDKARALMIVEDDLALQKQIKWSLDRFESVTASDRESALAGLAAARLGGADAVGHDDQSAQRTALH